MKKLNLFFIPIVLMLSIITSCTNPPAPAASPPGSIDYIDWEIQNIAPDFFNRQKNETAYLYFWIYFNESKLSAADFKSVTATPPNSNEVWSITDTAKIQKSYDSKDKAFSMLNLSDEKNPHSLPIGKYTFKIEFANGSERTETLVLPEPGSKTLGSSSNVYTENYPQASAPPSGYTPLPKRGTVDSAVYTQTDGKVTIKFKVNDSLVVNGRVVFYDSNTDSIGGSDFFKEKTGILNGGDPIKNDNNVNTVVLASADIKFETGKDINSIATGIVKLTDGGQYTGSSVLYDTSSISSTFTVTKR